MTKKHFSAIAAILAVWHHNARDDRAVQAAVDGIASDLAAALAQFNPNFDRARFLAACRSN